MQIFIGKNRHVRDASNLKLRRFGEKMIAANGRPLKSLLKFQRTVDNSGNRRSDRDSRVARPNKPQRNERIEPAGYACYRIISDFNNTY